MGNCSRTCKGAALDKAPGPLSTTATLMLLCTRKVHPLPRKTDLNVTPLQARDTTSHAHRRTKPSLQRRTPPLQPQDNPSVHDKPPLARQGMVELVSRVDHAQFIAVAQKKPRQKLPRGPHATASPSQRRRATSARQGRPRTHSSLSCPEPARAHPWPARHRDGLNPSPLSSSYCGRHHPVPHERPRHCLAAAVAPPTADSYLRHTPTLRLFKHPPDHGGHRPPRRSPQCFPD